jgi:branched-chain amino acid transport system substrate-binding protein
MNRNTERNLIRAAALGLVGAAMLAAGSAAADEIVIGASLPLSGPLAGFGSFEKWGYERAVAEVNAPAASRSTVRRRP